MKVVVTGATGFVGPHVIAAISSAGGARGEHDVTAWVRRTASVAPWLASRATLVELDLARPPADLEARLANVDVVVHLAVLFRETGPLPELDEVAASVRLFDACGRAGVPHVVFASSTAVHRPFGPRMSAADRIVTADAYGAAKASAEAFLHASAHTYGFRASIVRPGPVVGAPAYRESVMKTPRPIEEIVLAMRDEQPLRIVRGEGRQLASVEAVAQTIGKLVSSDEGPDTLVCVSREPVRWEDVARLACTKLGRSFDTSVELSDDPAPPIRFETDAIERWLERPIDVGAALSNHLDARLARMR